MPNWTNKLISAIAIGLKEVDNVLKEINKQPAPYTFDINALGDRGKNPLHIAVLRRKHDIVKLLLKHKADVNAKTRHGFTALHYAINTSNEANIRLLLIAGSDTEATDRNGQKAIVYAAKNGSSQNINILLQAGASSKRYNIPGTLITISPLHFAVRSGNLRSVQLLLDREAYEDMSHQDHQSLTPLMCSLRAPFTNISEELLEYGQNWNAVDSKRNTALHIAARHDANHDFIEHNIIPLFKAAKINIDSKNKYGETALHTAVRYNCLKNIKTLLEASASHTIKNDHGKTPVHYAKGKTLEHFQNICTESIPHPLLSIPRTRKKSL